MFPSKNTAETQLKAIKPWFPIDVPFKKTCFLTFGDFQQIHGTFSNTTATVAPRP
jgi:hypothetical protein